MTEKEAIYILRNAAWLGSNEERQKVEEAVEVVAKAIEAQNMTLYMNLPEVSVEEAVEILKRNNRIELLPSAQPERTCVNCGRTANNGGWYADGKTRCPIEEHYALPKDGYCHLWEKRNVTDDDYPERRTNNANIDT